MHMLVPHHIKRYISGSDRQLREVYNCSMQQCFETGDSCLNSLALANGMKALLAGADSGQGFVRCYRFPLEALDCTDYAAHCAPVSRIRVSLDDQFVFTCGEDGCVFVFDLRKQNLVSLPIWIAKMSWSGGLELVMLTLDCKKICIA